MPKVKDVFTDEKFARLFNEVFAQDCRSFSNPSKGLFPFIFMASIFMTDPYLRCQKCKEVFYFNGCPSCGGELIRRCEMRITC